MRRGGEEALGRTRAPWISPVTAGEAFAIAMVSWIVAWTLVIARRRLSIVLFVMVLSAASASYGRLVEHRYSQPMALVLQGQVRLRPAPYGPAPGGVQLAAATVVRIEGEMGPWVLARSGAEAGWVLRSELVRIS